MSFPYRYMSGLHTANLGSLDTTAGNETLKVTTPSGDTDALLQHYNLTQYVGTGEVWRPIGIYYTVTTGITVNAAKVTLRKNGVSPSSGGVATLAIASATTTVLYAPFTDYTFAAPDAAADQWSVLVTTTSTAGVVNPVLLRYATIPVVGLSDGQAV